MRISIVELKRRLENMVQIGTVHSSFCKDGKLLAKVILDNDGEHQRVSKALPVLSLVNSFGKVFFPIRAKEQVVVISPFGNANSGFIIRSIFNKFNKEPNGSNDHTAIIEFEDGARFSYDSKKHKLTIQGLDEIEFVAKKLNIKVEHTNFDGGKVTHNNTPIDDRHDHTQKTGDHFGAGAKTTPPNKK